MQTSFIKNFHNAMEDSMYDLCTRNRLNPKYVKIQEAYQRLLNEMMQCADHCPDKPCDEIEELSNALKAMDEDWIYFQGFLDCVALLKEIHVL